MIRSFYHGGVVAASLFRRHGTSATYHLSWTTDLGRKKNAAHLIPWDGFTRLKPARNRWLNLGGMNTRAPGLARFNLGLGTDAATSTGT